MIIATYNLLKGGSGKHHWSKMLEQYSVDLLLVQESYPPEEHLPPLLNPNCRQQAAWNAVSGQPWGTAVFSRTGSVVPLPIPDYEGWVIGAEINGADWQRPNGHATLIFSIHAPKRSGSYHAAVNEILDRVLDIADGREVIIGGDFNLTVSERYHTEKPAPKHAMAIQARLREDLELINCWQETNPGVPLAQTLRWTRNPTFPYHCDGIFAPKSWRERLRSCQVLTGPEWKKMSDHNPVIAEFG